MQQFLVIVIIIIIITIISIIVLVVIIVTLTIFVTSIVIVARFCQDFQAVASGYYVTINMSTYALNETHYYNKLPNHKELCFRVDQASPDHCINNHSNPCDEEPFKVDDRIRRDSVIQVELSKFWFDPIPNSLVLAEPSGLSPEYKLSYYSVTSSPAPNLDVGYNAIDQYVVKRNETFKIQLSVRGMYAIYAELTDQALSANWRKTRRFVLFDNESYIEIRPDKNIIAVSALPETNYTWQTHHDPIKLTWTGHFYNNYHVTNNLLKPIELDDKVLDTFDQTTGDIPVTGTS